MRLDKFISHCTPLSRKQSRAAVKSKRIKVNNSIVTDFSLSLQDNDEVSYQSEVLSLPGSRYFMLNKPEDVVCANTDPSTPCAVDLLDNEAPGLKVAGRLDKDTTGLVLLSDDGQWIHKIISPNHHCKKIYMVELDTELNDDTIAQFSKGILLKGESKPTKPASVAAMSVNSAKVIIDEGRYHQVKRMFAACGHHVKKLHRQQIGEIKLDDSLSPGQHRPLTGIEIKSVG